MLFTVMALIRLLDYKKKKIHISKNDKKRPNGRFFIFVRNAHCIVAFYPAPVIRVQPCFMRLGPRESGLNDLCVLPWSVHRLPW